MKVLLLNGKPLEWSGGLALDYKKALEEAGCIVDTLSEEMICNDLASSKQYKIVDWFIQKWSSLKYRLYHFIKPKYEDVYFTFPVKSEKVGKKTLSKILDSINVDYDFVLVVFWWRIITSETIRKISQVKHIPILALMVDYAPLTGGCMYPQNCDGFKHKCGFCPALCSLVPWDYSRFNLKTKNKNYSNCDLVLLSNTQIENDLKETYLAKRAILEKCILPIDPSKFRVVDKVVAKTHLNINDRFKFVIFAGAADLGVKRKGMIYMIEAVNKFYSSLNSVNQKEVVLVLAGKKNDALADMFYCDVLQLGLLNTEDLIYAYNSADVYLSPSIVDAGPSMVNQSLMCGTPVVSFNIGTAIDCIENGVNGYKVSLYDTDKFADGIKYFFELPTSKRDEMSVKTRGMAVSQFSTQVIGKQILYIFEKHFKQFLNIN